jgi:hypothetical protein
MSRTLVVIALFMVVNVVVSGQGQDLANSPDESQLVGWPAVHEFENIYELARRANVIHISIPVVSKSGEAIYLFVASGGTNDALLDRLSDETGINQVGWLGCRLVEGCKDGEASLLAEGDEKRFWHTRGQIYWDDLIGVRGDYPEYGRVRNFKLRGFRLQLEFFDFSGTETQMNERCKLKITVVNDDRATLAFAQPCAYSPPALRDKQAGLADQVSGGMITSPDSRVDQ